MGGHDELSGPDLSVGIDAGSLQPGGKLLGHAKDEAVLLARVGDELVAVGASCTHYGGPLADGVIDGDTVRCPWHHACFSLRTGEALRAPALNPVACWKVERRGEKVAVTDKVERDPLAPTYPARIDRAASPRDVVIIGAGAAGSAAAEMLRRCGYDGRITVVDDDSGAPYDRPNLSKDYLAGTAPEEGIPLRADGFYEKHDVKLIHERVARLDPAAKAITLAGQRSISYDALLVATGAEPVRLKLAGDGQSHVHYLRSLTDSRAIADAAKQARRAVVIGGSFIGLEVAASLRARNLDVHVVAPEKLPLGRVLGEHLGSFIRAFHEEHGVVFHLGHTPQRIERDSVVLDDGSRLEADLVVIGVGVRPRLELAEQAGLAIDKGTDQLGLFALTMRHPIVMMFVSPFRVELTRTIERGSSNRDAVSRPSRSHGRRVAQTSSRTVVVSFVVIVPARNLLLPRREAASRLGAAFRLVKPAFALQHTGGALCIRHVPFARHVEHASETSRPPRWQPQCSPRRSPCTARSNRCARRRKFHSASWRRRSVKRRRRSKQAPSRRKTS